MLLPHILTQRGIKQPHQNKRHMQRVLAQRLPACTPMRKGIRQKHPAKLHMLRVIQHLLKDSIRMHVGREQSQKVHILLQVETLRFLIIDNL